MPHPRRIVLAGPPGSAKTSSFPVTAVAVDGFNIDDRCAQILGSYRAIPRHIRPAVASSSVLKAEGSARRNEVRAIHEASFASLGAAIDVFERVDVYDSTAPWSARLVATSHTGRIDRLGVIPSRFEKALPLPKF